MENKLILGYWPIRGIAQPIRFFLEYLGLPYEEKLYTDHQEWFSADYVNFAHPFANLPYLKDGEKVLYYLNKGCFRI
jgi:glutathione S-transferase